MYRRMSGRVGDVVELRWWFNGDEDKALSKRYLSDAMAAMAFTDGVILGPVTFEVIGVEDSTLPPPPDNFPGTPKCLCAISRIVGLRSFSRFTMELEDEDLARLRGYTRMGAKEDLSDEACDAIINEYGPEVALKTVH